MDKRVLGQIGENAAADVLREFEVDRPVLGMVKDDKHRTRALAAPDGRELGLEGNPAAFALIGRVQEETHRFAIEYQRSLRSRHIGSELDKIPGVGEKRRNELLKRFRSVKVRWQDTDFKVKIRTFTGFTAQIIQHETDHLNGILI